MDGNQTYNEEISEVHSCDKCNQVFKTKTQLGHHKDVMHMDIEITESLKSDDTSSPTANTSNISVTQRPHLIKFDCENCMKQFSNRTQLFKHMNEHITDPT